MKKAKKEMSGFDIMVDQEKNLMSKKTLRQQFEELAAQIAGPVAAKHIWSDLNRRTEDSKEDVKRAKENRKLYAAASISRRFKKGNRFKLYGPKDFPFETAVTVVKGTPNFDIDFADYYESEDYCTEVKFDNGRKASLIHMMEDKFFVLNFYYEEVEDSETEYETGNVIGVTVDSSVGPHVIKG
jgi:hypothetical protein